MMKHYFMRYLGAILISSSLVLWGCPKNAQVSEASGAQKEHSAAAAETGKNDEASAAAPSAASSEGAKEGAMAATAGLQPIYFDYNNSLVRDDAKAVMRKNAEWLKANANMKIRVEGNCDERGTTEYNQALGQRRAASARKFLTDLGISGRRITLVSYGKEKPVCTENSETCWQRNRRDDFVVVN